MRFGGFGGIFDTIFGERITGAYYDYNLSYATDLQEVADATVIDGAEDMFTAALQIAQ